MQSVTALFRRLPDKIAFAMTIALSPRCSAAPSCGRYWFCQVYRWRVSLLQRWRHPLDKDQKEEKATHWNERKSDASWRFHHLAQFLLFTVRSWLVRALTWSFYLLHKTTVIAALYHLCEHTKLCFFLVFLCYRSKYYRCLYQLFKELLIDGFIFLTKLCTFLMPFQTQAVRGFNAIWDELVT